MRFFFKTYSVCQQCKVHFDPAPTERHSELCPQHRKPVVELEDRILLVVNWAKANWEKMEPQAIAETNKINAMSQEALQRMYNQHMAQPSRSAVSSMMNAMNPLGF